LYSTGVTIRDNRVEEINPPINTYDSGEYKGFSSIAIGIRPPMAVMDVSRIGTKTDLAGFLYGIVEGPALCP
jgi:hypothetical protein